MVSESLQGGPQWSCLPVYICVASPAFYGGSPVQPVAYGGRDAVSCLRLGYEGLWLLSWAFSLFHPHAQMLRSLALAEASCPAARWCPRPCSVPYQKTQDKSDKLGLQLLFFFEVIKPNLINLAIFFIISFFLI